jgi:hypothetical protein
MGTRRASIRSMCLVSAATVLAGLSVGGEAPPMKPARAAGPGLTLEAVGHHHAGPLSPVQKAVLKRGYLVPDQETYDRQKTEAAKLAVSPGPRSPAGASLAPVSLRSWKGIHDPNHGPSDSTGAIGTKRYIELVNSQFAIFDRTSNSPLATGSLNSLAGADSLDFVFDPQIMWDPGTSRFYYVMDDIIDESTNLLLFGFSKTASPSSAGDWCKYSINYGSEFPDYPKMGDSKRRILVGTNVFNSSGPFLRTDLAAITKPVAGDTCQAPETLTLSLATNLLDAKGRVAWTPVPANQTDDSSAGWVVATKCCSGGLISVFKVTENSDGTISVGAARTLDVPSYSVPQSAPQSGSVELLDTLDTRLTQAVSAIDPTRGSGGSVAIWTQHTVLGGAGAQVRWYEIRPKTPSLYQSGTLTSASRFYFNAAISPDRKVKGSTTAFGQSMVIGYNTTSPSQLADIRMASKIGSGPVQEAVAPVKQSTGPLEDFSCDSNLCRWGDYAGATPDPGAPASSATGQVWLTNQWSVGSSCCAADWRSWNWAASP